MVSTINLKSCLNSYSAIIDVHILPKITGYQPTSFINAENWLLPKNIHLADPLFFKPQKIDLLIGAELFFNLLTTGQIKLAEDLPTLQNTVFGWIVSGKITFSAVTPFNTFCCITSNESSLSLESIIEKFWTLESSTNIQTNRLSSEEEECESYFSNTTRRDINGRYIVNLPFLKSTSFLGDSQQIALKRYLNLEKRLNKIADLKSAYVKFMNDYRDSGHMVLVSENEFSDQHYFLPHHCVLKPDSSTTKLRVVFDASAPTTTGVSLNNILMVGPVVQPDLFAILIRFRAPKYVFSADISQMYRQIKIDTEHSHFQYIFWRDNTAEKIKIYRLTTVTYGTASAPYLATRCLKQIAMDTRSTYPLASDVIMNNTYIDDCLAGSNSIEEAIKKKLELQEMLGTIKMKLHKWCSNERTILSDIPEDHQEIYLKFNDCELIKTLGLYWQPESDQFKFNIRQQETNYKITKRSVISEIARIFDPLGIVAPVITLGKLFMQQLWQIKQNWDEELPQLLSTKWRNYKDELLLLNSVGINRHLFNFSASPSAIQIHGFADASEKAYGAVVYVRCKDENGHIAVTLLCSKSRVAPLSKTTLPRLELCAAHLLTQLVARLVALIKFKIENIFFWSDSTIVLHWLNAPSAYWKTFVANRVAFIQENSEISKWYHVETKKNPADFISRGVTPSQLLKSTTWFNGPQFLQSEEDQWNKRFIKTTTFKEPERRKEKIVLHTNLSENKEDLINNIKFKTNYIKLRNIFGYVLRFIKNARLNATDPKRKTGQLDIEELEDGLQSIILIIQENAFYSDIMTLRSNKSIHKKSRLVSLSPFLDEKGVLRVGGRLQNSSLPYHSKHPIVLPSNHQFTLTLLNYYHFRNLHIGPQGLLAAVRQKYWPLNGRRISNKICRECIQCFKAKPSDVNQFMGNLPARRIQFSPPFKIVGVDFCGPFYLHYKIRGKIPTKAYLAIFVCFSVKAVHIELVTDLTTAAFIGALKRFIATRGLCEHIYCDNGTNFVGAKNELNQLYKLFNSQQHQEFVINECRNDNIKWHFNPPGSPHFGGLFEAAVKSAKNHLKRVMGNASLTFEELGTLIKQVEAVLNSRPLTPLSSDPSDLEVLTPGHFLIGRPLTSIVEPNIISDKISSVRRWQLVQQLQQHFWSRWHKEYLSELQHRRKWNLKSKNISIGDLVLVKDENMPPQKWRVGRIIELHPGADDLVRVVTIKTAHGSLKRAITKICVLPIDIESPELSRPGV